MTDNKLIFLVSQPRSGSTLLQSLLSNNSEINTTSEPWLLLPFLTFNKPELQKGVFDSELAKNGIEDYLSKFKLNSYFKKELQNFLIKLYEPLNIDNVKYILDKTPRYYEILDLITEFFPNAKIIVLKRNPLDVLKSILNTWNVKHFPGLSAYSRDILHAPFLIDSFVRKNQDNPNVYEIKYESLLLEPEMEMAKIYNWLNIEFNSSVLNYRQNKKIEGAMGDKVGIYKYNEVNNKKTNEDNSINYSVFWESFFQGYINYLNVDFLHSYGDYSFDYPNKATKVFNEFLFLNKLGYYNEKSLNFKNIYSLLKFKVKARLSSEYLY